MNLQKVDHVLAVLYNKFVVPEKNERFVQEYVFLILQPAEISLLPRDRCYCWVGTIQGAREVPRDLTRDLV